MKLLFIFLIVILVSTLVSAGTTCSSCVYTNPKTVEVEVWPAEKYVSEQLIFRVYNQQGASKERYSDFEINLAHIDESGMVTETFVLKTNASGETIFVSERSGKYRVRLDGKDVYFTVNSRGVVESPTQINPSPTSNETPDKNDSPDLLLKPTVPEPPEDILVAIPPQEIEDSITDNTLWIIVAVLITLIVPILIVKKHLL